MDCVGLRLCANGSNPMHERGCQGHWDFDFDFDLDLALCSNRNVQNHRRLVNIAIEKIRRKEKKTLVC